MWMRGSLLKELFVQQTGCAELDKKELAQSGEKKFECTHQLVPLTPMMVIGEQVTPTKPVISPTTTPRRLRSPPSKPDEAELAV